MTHISLLLPTQHGRIYIRIYLLNINILNTLTLKAIYECLTPTYFSYRILAERMEDENALLTNKNSLVVLITHCL